jgi:hypothetical protein
VPKAATPLPQTPERSLSTSTGKSMMSLLRAALGSLSFSHRISRRSRIDLLQREVSDLNSKLIAAAPRSQHDDGAAEWAPYFQAAQRDHAQKIQVFEMHSLISPRVLAS